MDWKHALVRFAPLTSLGLCLQILFVLVSPTDSVSTEFIPYAHDLFVSEIVFMHSAVFWNLKNQMAKEFWSKFFLSLFLFVAYGLFILPMAQKNGLVGAGYLLYCATHIFEFDQKHWLQETKVLQKYIEPKDHKFIIGTFSMLKACYFGLFLTIISYFVPSNPDLTPDFIADLTGNKEDAGETIMAIKTLFLYFLGLSIFELYQLAKKFRSSKSTSSLS